MLYYKDQLMKCADFLYADTNIGKPKVAIIIINKAIMVKKRWGFRDHGTLKAGVSHKWFDQVSTLIGWFLCTEIDVYSLKLPNFLFWDGSSNYVVRYLKLKKLITIWVIKFIFCFHWATKICYFGLCYKILLTNQFAGFFTFTFTY